MAETVARERQASTHSPIARLLLLLGRALNPLLVPLAGARFIPVWAVVRHRGRRSGRLYATPVAIQATADGFVVPLPYGERTDWCRNVLAAGGGTVRWNGAEHIVEQPRVVDAAVGLAAFNAIERPLLRLFGTRRFLMLRRTREESASS